MHIRTFYCRYKLERFLLDFYYVILFLLCKDLARQTRIESHKCMHKENYSIAFYVRVFCKKQKEIEMRLDHFLYAHIYTDVSKRSTYA